MNVCAADIDIPIADVEVWLSDVDVSRVRAVTGRPSMGKVRHAKSQREVELERLVEQAYAQLHRLKESKKGGRDDASNRCFLVRMLQQTC